MIWKWVWHDWQKANLEKIIKSGNHAILLSWPKWIWKLQIAKDLAKNILYDWTNDNQISREIDLNIYQDFIILDKLWIEWVNQNLDEISRYTNISQTHRSNKSSPAKTNTISIDDIHEIINLSSKSSINKSKVIIISDIERMNKNAFNALLKTLEEPPTWVVFICTSSNSAILNPTILSRFQVIKFNYLKWDELKKFIINTHSNLSEQESDDVVNYSFWKIVSVKSFVNNSSELLNTKDLFSKVQEIFKNGKISVKFKRAILLSENSDLLEHEMEIWHYFLRSSLYGDKFPYTKVVKALLNLFLLKKDIKENVNKRIAIENFYLSL